jgi:nicotinamidase-related amidase
MDKPVLLVIDMLNDYLSNWEPERKQRLVRGVNELVSTMRSYSLPIVWVRQEFESDLRDAFPEMRAKGIHITIKGTEGCQIAPELSLAPTDTVIVKKRYSAFFGTQLDGNLAELGPDAIIVAGINTHACIRTTAIDAYQRDWKVILASDCIDSYDRGHHEISIKYMENKIAFLMNNREIRTALHSGAGTKG